jgi:C-terminal processing protease CtpA/Prc
MTASMAEHTARILQRECGAIIIGERTSGAEAGLVRIDGPEGGRVSYGETRLVDRTGVGLQVEGVVPDISIRVTQQNVAAFGPDRALTDWDERMFEAAERVIRNANATRK